MPTSINNRLAVKGMLLLVCVTNDVRSMSVDIINDIVPISEKLNLFLILSMIFIFTYYILCAEMVSFLSSLQSYINLLVRANFIVFFVVWY